MGYARWDPDDWKIHAAATAGKPTAAVFTANGMVPELNPFGVKLREARDSAVNPNSTAIIAALDVTGSMGMIADVLARQGLGTLVEELLRRRPVPDPQVMVMGVGDAACDDAPLQVSQFEPDIRIVEQLTRIWLEKGGGGNNCESYTFPWYFAAMHTAIDCFEKRGKRGYLFTVGDEEPPPVLYAAQIKRFVDADVARDLDARTLLTMVERRYHVFHLVVEEGYHARAHPKEVLAAWRDLLGQRVLRLADHTKLAEVIVSAIEVTEGRDVAAVAGTWMDGTGAVVKRALQGLVPARTGAGRKPVRL